MLADPEVIRGMIRKADERETINGLTAYLTTGPGFGRVELSGTSMTTTTFLAVANPLQESTCHELARSAYRSLLGVLNNYGTPAVPPLYPHPNG